MVRGGAHAGSSAAAQAAAMRAGGAAAMRVPVKVEMPEPAWRVRGKLEGAQSVASSAGGGARGTAQVVRLARKFEPQD